MEKRTRRIILFSLAFVFSLCVFSTQISQTKAATINPQNDISLTTVPANPTPGSQVSGHIDSSLFDLQQAKITWSLDGRVKESAVGDVDFVFPVGKLGSITNIGVSVITADGQKIDKNTSVEPAGVDLTWEALSTVPPFYKGKALFPPEGNIKIVALPDIIENGTRVADKNLIYKWTIDRQVDASQSGYGKNTYAFQGSILSQPVTVQVEVSSLGGNATALNQIVINPQNPQVIFYEDDPIFGVKYEKNIGSRFPLNDPEIKITAFPYFMNQGDSLDFAWQMNGISFENKDKNSTVLRQTTDAGGSSAISLTVKNNDNFMQEGQADSSIVFSGTKQSSQ